MADSISEEKMRRAGAKVTHPEIDHILDELETVKEIPVSDNKVVITKADRARDGDEAGCRDRGEPKREMSMRFELKQIGTIRTPYTDKATFQPINNDKGEFRIVIDPLYAEGLRELDLFHYIYVIYYMHRIKRKESMTVIPPWTGDMKVGLFASRSPVRPNPIGLSIARVKRIVNNEIFTSGLDVLDGTPLIDIKPYIKDLDSKCDANYGWIAKLEDQEHLSLHIQGIPHDY